MSDPTLNPDPDHKMILPTKSCFDDAMDLFCDVLISAEDWPSPEREKLLSELFLVHAVVKVLSNRESSHAWLEDDGREVCLFVGLLDGKPTAFMSPREAYYEAHNVQEFTRYNYQEAHRMNLKFGTFGPWEERYQVLCGGSPEMAMIAPLPVKRISE